MQTSRERKALLDSVQHNCHVSDARYAGNYTLCIYLLKMREFYRWEHGYTFRDALPKEEVGSWLRQRESLWEELEEAEFSPLQVNDEHFEPFAVEEINARLGSDGLLYGAGLGVGASPHFFLAELEQRHEVGDCTIHVAGQEYARDLTAPPAMSQGKNIYIRKQSLRRFMWERLENWNWNRPHNAMARALQHFDVKNELEHSLDEMTELELNSVLQHEFGEVEAGRLLGETWHELLLALPRSRVEFMARAVRDLLADSLTTLPYLLDQQNEASIHFYLANHTGMRQEMAPGLKQAYQEWLDSHNLSSLERYAEKGRSHWLETAEQLLELYSRQGLKGMKAMQGMLEASTL